MEVHTHTHTPADPGTHRALRKKWTHYFWEFLMLFLAVFCGFFAEYMLEHKIEKERAKQYIFSFYKDVIADTTEFPSVIADYEFKLKALKNRRDCYDSIKMNVKSNNCLLRLFRSSRGFTDLIPSDQTILQLKNSGGFRLLSNADSDSILQYDKMVRHYVIQETTGYQKLQYDIRDVYYSLFNYGFSGSSEANEGVGILFSENTELVNRYFNSLDQYYSRSEDNLERLYQLKQKALRLIEYLKKKYGFD